MKRTLIIIAMTAVAAVGAQAQLLYKVSGGGLEKPSYIIGTHHLANVGFVEKINGVKDALTETAQVYGELKWDDVTNRDSAAVLRRCMMLPDGQTLKNVLTNEQYQKLDNFLTKKMGVGLSHPQVEAQMGRMTPMALVNQLEVLMYLQSHMGEIDPSSTFDQYFQAQAKKNNEPCGGLETLSFQGNLLYKSYPMERQIQLLMCLIDNENFYVQMLEKLTKAFYAQDLNALKRAMDEKIGNSCDATPAEETALIEARNAAWTIKMLSIMQDNPTFFAVGAGHLPGQKGLLQLLRDAGYTVESVN